MLEQLMQMIQQGGQQSIVNNPEVPNEQNTAIMEEAHNSITNGLKDFASTGELEKLSQSVQNGEPVSDQSPVVQKISGNFSDNIMQKFGLNSGVAKMIAASIIPMIIGKIMNKGTAQNQANPQGGFDLGGLLSSLTGGGTASQGTSGGLMGKISSIGAKFGLDKDGDGDVDMDDLKKMI